jgi:energy-coupling factor transporter ATP-binding protein EcfA2
MSESPQSLLSYLAELWRRLLLRLAGDPTRWPVHKQLRHFFGKDVDRVETHEKQFPGYDIASINRALHSFSQDCTSEWREIGSLAVPSLRQFLDLGKLPAHYYHTLLPAPPVYQRAPVDVDEEISVVVNTLCLGVMRPEAGRVGKKPAATEAGSDGPPPRRDEKIAIFLTTGVNGPEYWDGMEANRVPQQMVNISIACGSRSVADRFFAEIEERRKRLSVYQGKVIDPVLQGGLIHAIGFRALKRVSADDLVLPDAIKQLLHRAIVGFYNHKDLLENLGIDMKRGILLHGPPGTGKTSISLYLAGLLPRFTVCYVSGERLLYPREICRMARYLQPAMVVFEDIDLVASARDSNGLATVLGELMNQIDGCEPADQVLFLMNTNSLKRLEGAVRNRPGRVDQIIEIPLPDRAARLQLIRYFARHLHLNLDEPDRVLQATDRMTPAMLKEVVKRAAVSAIDRDGSNGKGVVVGESDLLLAAEQVQAMREPIAAPGKLGFQATRP